MADEVEEVTTTSKRSQPYQRARPPGLSPLATGLLYGGAATAVAGPVGLLAGLFHGILSQRNRESYLDSAARASYNSRIRFDGINDQIKQELQVADPDEARLLRSAQQQAEQGWQILQSGDPSGRDLIEQAYATTQGIMNADIQARKAEQASQFNAQRGLITSAAPTLRDQYSTVINNARQVDSISQRVLSLTADPNFDPNKPFNRAVLAEMISVGGTMFRDNPEGFWAGLAAGGAGTVVGSIAQGVDVLLDSEKFKITREDFNRLAVNARQVTQQYGQQRLQEISQQAAGLDDWGRRVGVIPSDYSLSDYVSGGVKDLKVAPSASVPSVRPLSDNQPMPNQPARQEEQTSWQPRASSGPPRRMRPQLQAAPLQVLTPQDDWARDLLGLPTSRQRRPTN
jgi:hypothetical protein